MPAATAVFNLRVQRGGLGEPASLLASLLARLRLLSAALRGRTTLLLQSLGLSGPRWALFEGLAEDFEDSRGA